MEQSTQGERRSATDQPATLSWLKFDVRVAGYSIQVIGTRSDSKQFYCSIVQTHQSLDNLQAFADDLTGVFQLLDQAGHIHQQSEHDLGLEDGGRCVYTPPDAQT